VSAPGLSRWLGSVLRRRRWLLSLLSFALLMAIWASPAEALPRLVYADWLEENGWADEAGLVRIECELVGTPPDAKRAEELERRRSELLLRVRSDFLLPS